MEAIGFTASVGALVTITAQVGTLLSTYISEVRDAPEVLSNLLSEISSLTTVITNLKRTIDSDVIKSRIEQDLLTGHKGEHWRFVRKAVEDCSKTLRSLQSEWEPRSEPHRKRPRVIHMAVTQFRLASEDSKIKSYRLRILTAKDAINISFMALSVTSQFELQGSVNNLIPRLDETSEKINEVLGVLNERIQRIQLRDDMESISIARRVVETASDIVSTASTTIMTVTDRSETQSVLFHDPDRQNVVSSWIGKINSPVSHELISMELSKLGCETLHERGLAAFAKKLYEDAETLLEHYLVVVQSEELEDNCDKVLEAILKLCSSCLHQNKLEKTREKLESATEVATTPIQMASLHCTYASYYLHENILDISAAESAWRNAATCLISTHGSLDSADSASFDLLRMVKLEILRRRDPTEHQFWTAALNARHGTGTLNGSQRRATKARRLRKPTTSENREIGHAIKIGDTSYIEKLMAQGINILAFEDGGRDGSGYRALHFAIKYHQEILVKLFLRNGADPNQLSGIDLSLPLTLAADIEDKTLAITIFELLLQNGAVLQTKGQFVIGNAAKRGNYEIVRMLIEKDPDAVIIRESPATAEPSLRLASQAQDIHDQFEVVKLLVQAGAKINRCYYREPTFWCFEPSTPSFRYLVENGADVKLLSYSKSSLLHSGYFLGHLDFSPPMDLIPFYISQGLDINIIDKDGYTPLISAIKAKMHDLALKLIELRCDVNARGGGVRSALYHALVESETRFREVARIILDKGGKVDREDITLHDAITSGDERLIEMLINAGVDVNEYRYPETEIPLAWARKRDPVNERIIELLKDNGGTE